MLREMPSRTFLLGNWKLSFRLDRSRAVDRCRGVDRYSANQNSSLLVLTLRPPCSDPGAGCQKILFLEVSASLSGFGPFVAHGKLSVRGRCVQATKNKAETCFLLDAIGRRSCGRPRDWV